MADYNFFGLCSRSFEQLIQSLSIKIIGPDVVIFGDGPDGGREATFDGEILYPNRENKWKGYGVIQAKFKQKTEGTEKDGKWALAELEKELKKFTSKEKKLKKPKYYIFVTNVTLSPVNEKGAKDKARKIFDSYKDTLPLKGFAVWDNDQIRSFLDADRDVRTCYGAWITPGDVLAKLIEAVEIKTPDFQSTIENYLQKEMLADHYVNLGQAGHATDGKTALGKVFIDLPVADEPSINPPEEKEGAVTKGFADYIVCQGDMCLRPYMNKARGIPEERVKEAGRYVLIGGPGQGKTTIGQFICQIYRTTLLDKSGALPLPEAREVIREIKEQCEKDAIATPGCKRFPLRVVLNEYASVLAKRGNENPVTLLSFLLKKIKDKANADISPGDFKNWLKNYPWLIILDGLDEVPASSNREELLLTVSDFLVDVAQLDADIMIVATSRPQGYDKGRDFSSDYYRHTYLAPLSNDRALFYGRRLAEIRYCADEGRKNKVITRLERALKQPETARLMRSPLQVTIMATLVEQIGQPPQERWRLFKEYYEVISRREKEREIPAAEIIRDFKPDIDALHNRVGLQLQVESEGKGNTEARLSTPRFRDIISKRLSEEGHEKKDLDALLKKIIEAAMERLVFLVGLESEKIGFEIRSLQEFMAAEYLVDKSDELVQKRLHAIAPAAHWRNVFLFACGKCFAERQHLRDVILAICDQLNEDDGSGISRAVLAGSVLALDLIEDGPARKQPKYSHALLRNALRLLDCRLSENIWRLGAVYESSFEGVYREEILRRISDIPLEKSYISWMLLLNLVKQGVSWAQEAANTHWFSQQPMQVKFFVQVSSNRDEEHVRSEFLIKKLKECLERTSIKELNTLANPLRHFLGITGKAIDLGGWDWFCFDAIGVEIGLLGPESPLKLRVNSVESNIKVNVNTNTNHPFQHFLVHAAHFHNDPSQATLAAAVDAFPVEEGEYFVFLFRRFSWPLLSCIEYCTTHTRKEYFLKKIKEGELGDVSDWLAAEKRWRRFGVQEDDILSCDDMDIPFKRDISNFGIYFSTFLYISCNRHINRNFLKTVHCLLFKIRNQNMVKIFLNIYIFSLSCFQDALDKTFLLTEEMQRLFTSVSFDSYSFWRCINKIHFTSFSASEEAFFHEIGMKMEVWCRITEDNNDMKTFIYALEMSISKNPGYQGLLRILAGYVIFGGKTTSLHFQDVPDFDDPIDRGNKLLLRLASDQLGGMKCQEFVDTVLHLTNEKNNLHERVAMLVKSHNLEGVWIEQMLTDLDKRMPDYLQDSRKEIQGYLVSLYRKHTSSLAELKTRQTLELPLVDIAPQT